MREEILRRLAKRIAPGHVEDAVKSLQTSPELVGDLDWLGEVLDAAEALPLPKVPVGLTASLHDLMGPDPSAGPQSEETTRIEQAVLIHDSRTSGPLVGARGEHPGKGWTAVFTAAAADVILDGDQQDGEAVEVSGQMLLRSGDSQRFVVEADGPSQRATESDELGQFEFGELPAGTYEFSARQPALEVRWSAAIGSER